MVTITITGTNDVPTLVGAAPAPASIEEPLTGNTTLSGSNIRTGSIVVTDADGTAVLGVGSSAGSGAGLIATAITDIRTAATFTFSDTNLSLASLASGDQTDLRNAFDITSATFNEVTNELTINWTYDNITTGAVTSRGIAGGTVGTST